MTEQQKFTALNNNKENKMDEAAIAQAVEAMSSGATIARIQSSGAVLIKHSTGQYANIPARAISNKVKELSVKKEPIRVDDETSDAIQLKKWGKLL